MRIGFVLAALLMMHGAMAHAQDFPCEPAIADLLTQHGQFLDTFTNVRVQPYTWSNDVDPQVSGWRFSGVPPECSGGTAGSVIASMWADCSITDIYSTGNCRIPGIRYGWL